MLSVLQYKKGRAALLLGACLAVFLFLVVSFFIFTPHASALDVGINQVEGEIELGGADIRIVIARIIRVALGFLGVAALLIVLWGGFQWMTAGGDDEKVASAKRTLINGSIGLALILSAFAITQFILNALVAATTGFGPGGPGGGPVVSPRSGSLGRGVIDMHYPPRGATGIPRNTNIIITFKQPMLISSIIDGYDDNDTPDNLADDPEPRATSLNTNTVRIYRTADGPDGALASDGVAVRLTPDRKTFVFDPASLLGSPSENVLYTVDLPGDGLLLENGSQAFVGNFSDGYAWQFETSTIVDLVPPIVTDCFPVCPVAPPAEPALPLARNVLIQVNFNEAIDPTSVSLPGNVVVNAGGLAVGGSWNIANQYRTIEFVTEDECGTNSCGETIYCLPESATIGVTVQAAVLTDEPDDGPTARAPYSGVADVAANSLNDRGANALADGPPADNVSFSFLTSDEIDLVGPRIESVSPDILEGEVAPDVPARIIWNEVMSRSSLNTSSAVIVPVPDHELWYSVSSENLRSIVPPEPVGPDDLPLATRSELNHALFYRAPVGAPSQGYATGTNSLARDAFQNCYVPGSGPGAVPGATCGVTPAEPYCCNGEATDNPICQGIDLRLGL
ncbi:hypothetical protein HY478_01640 [Candidatus Uhrbacteria bacterium]|nr:hypothetical protein [Candidatus Uhrbacteria bacterium]